MADQLLTRLEAIDKEVEDKEAKLTTTEEELSKNPTDSLLAKRDRLVKALADLSDRQRNLENKLQGHGPQDYLKRFQELLKEARIDRPKEAVLALIVRRLSSRLLAAGSVQTAVELYEDAQLMPGPSTEAQILKQKGLYVNGPLLPDLSSGLLTATDARGRPCVLKLLRHAQPIVRGSEASGEAGGSEAAACRELCCRKPKDVPLVDAEVITFTLGHEHSAMACHGPGVYAAVLMPHYVNTLARLAPIPPSALLAGIQRMEAALDWIHSKGFVHMDVKADNIFVDSKGRWWLGDFGSAVRAGSPIISTTRCFAPPAANTTAIAVPQFDWHMLAVAGVIGLLRSQGMGDQWQDMLIKDGYTPLANILSALDVLGSRQIDEAGEVLTYLRNLVERADVQVA